MTLTIELTPIEAAQLTAAACQAGLEPAELARKFVTEHLPPVTPATPEDPTLALFAQWDADDAPMTPEDIAAAQARNAGTPTAAPSELDCDVLLAAQALTLDVPEADRIIATTNVGHLAQFVAADLWTHMTP